MTIRMYVSVCVMDLDRAVTFYTQELALFDIAGEREYKGSDRLARMKADGNVYLRLREAPQFGIALMKCEACAKPGPGPAARESILLEIPRVEQLFTRLSSVTLPSGASVSGALLSTPIGDMFSVIDPAGNRVNFMSALDPDRGGVL